MISLLFLFFRRRGAIPTEALSVSPAQHRYLEQERRIRRQIFACRVLFLILFLVSWEVSARIGILNDFIFSSPSPRALLFSFHGGGPDDLLSHGDHDS